jgi:hypothetical protein
VWGELSERAPPFCTKGRFPLDLSENEKCTGYAQFLKFFFFKISKLKKLKNEFQNISKIKKMNSIF